MLWQRGFQCSQSISGQPEPSVDAAGPQSVFGYQVCGETAANVGLSAAIGSDCPAGTIDWLKRYGVATQVLIQSDRATPRAWQLFEADGLRTQVWRTRYPDDSLYASMLRPPWNTMAPILKQSSAYHIGVHPEHFEIDLLRSLKTRSIAPGSDGNTTGIASPPGSQLPWLSAETFTQASRPISMERLQKLLSAVDLFSPNLVEAESMLGLQDPEQVSVAPSLSWLDHKRSKVNVCMWLCAHVRDMVFLCR